MKFVSHSYILCHANVPLMNEQFTKYLFLITISWKRGSFNNLSKITNYRMLHWSEVKSLDVSYTLTFTDDATWYASVLLLTCGWPLPAALFKNAHWTALSRQTKATSSICGSNHQAAALRRLTGRQTFPNVAVTDTYIAGNGHTLTGYQFVYVTKKVAPIS